MKLLALACLVCGEGLVIYAEESSARSYAAAHAFGSTFRASLIPLAVGAVLLVLAYMIGLRSFHNIWTVSAVSFGSVIVIEPLFNFFYMGQTPSLGSGVGALLGVLGMGAALFL